MNPDIPAFIVREGVSSLAPQMLYPGMTMAWQDGTVVSGHQTRGYRIMAGPPCGPPSRWRAASAGVESEARASGQRVLWFGLQAGECEALAAAPFRRIPLGDQAILDARQWADMKSLPSSLRSQVRRGGRHGLQLLESPLMAKEWAATVWRYPWLPEALAECRAGWLKRQGRFTLGFMTTCLSPRHPSWWGYPLRYLTAALGTDMSGRQRVVGYAVASAVPRARAFLVENFVRHCDAPNGLMEMLLHRLAQWGLRVGCAEMNMGLAPLWHGVPDASAPPLWYRSTRWLLRQGGEPLYHFHGLGRFKQRLHPKRWEPLYLVAPRNGFKPLDGLALAGAFLAKA